MVTDLNLLRVLDALLDTSSVTAAARRLFLSPSAVSRSLSRLRRLLDDPLFVQVGRSFQPTPRALELRTPTIEALRAADAVLRTRPSESPHEFRRTFTISADDALAAAFASALTRDLAEHAPGVRVRFITDDDHDTALDTGAADLDLGIAPNREHLQAEVLFTDHHVLTARSTSAIHHRRSLAAALGDLTHVLVARHHTMRAVLDQHMPPPARSVEVASHLTALHILVGDPQAVAVLPSALVSRFGPTTGLRVRELPFELPTLTISQSWHIRNDSDVVLRWLRGRIRELSHGG